jgi:hypothetical protein
MQHDTARVQFSQLAVWDIEAAESVAGDTMSAFRDAVGVVVCMMAADQLPPSGAA